jgi:hypothetical protein
VRVDALLDAPGAVELIGRYGGLDQFDYGGSQGYHLRVVNDGRWALLSERLNGFNRTLASGHLAFGVRRWHTLALQMRGPQITAYLDGRSLASAHDSSYDSGNVGILVSSWQKAQFDNFTVLSAGK